MDDEKKESEFSITQILNEYKPTQETTHTVASDPAEPVSPQPVDELQPTAVFQPERGPEKEQLPVEKKATKKPAARRKKKKSSRAPKIVALLVLVVLVIMCGAAAGYTFTTDTIYEGVSAAGVELGGMTRVQAAQALQSHEQEIGAGKIQLDINGKIYEVDAAEVTEGIDANETAQAAYTYGRTGNPIRRIQEALSARFNGVEIEFSVSVDKAALETHLDEIAADALTVPVQPTYEIIESNLVITSGKVGVDFDRDALEEEIVSRIGLMDYSPITVEVETAQPDPIDLEAIQKEIECESAPATVDKSDGKTIIGGVTGIKMDLAAAKAIVGDGTEPTYTIPLEITEPAVSAEELEELLFRDTLASTSTSLNAGNKARTNNVRLAASHINGTILNPGEEFSYNGVVGERTAARGFQSAGAYVSGRVVDEVGGGVCQPSSTLYMAVLRADLEVTERRNHSFTVSYTPLGEDATVSWGTQDFKFVNNTDYPIKIYAEQSGSSMSVRIVGTNIDGKKVTTSHKVLSTTDYTTVYKNDNTLPAGTTQVDQTGSTGYKVVTYKTITVNGESTTVEANRSTYQVRNKTVLLGPGVTVDADGNIVKETDPATKPAEPETPTAPAEPTTPAQPETPAEPTAPTEPSGGDVISIPTVDPES